MPKGAREALVRYVARQVNTTCLFDLRIDADYREPHAGLAPVRVTYVYDDDGVEKRAVRISDKASDSWPITCVGKPMLKQLIVERVP